MTSKYCQILVYKLFFNNNKILTLPIQALIGKIICSDAFVISAEINVFDDTMISKNEIFQANKQLIKISTLGQGYPPHLGAGCNTQQGGSWTSIQYLCVGPGEA